MGHTLSICGICGEPFDWLDNMSFYTDEGNNVCQDCGELKDWIDKELLGKYIKSNYGSLELEYEKLKFISDRYDIEDINTLSDYELGGKYIQLWVDDFEESRHGVVPDKIIRWPEPDTTKYIVINNIDKSLSINDNIVNNVGVFEKLLPFLTSSDKRIESLRLAVSELSSMYKKLYVNNHDCIILKLRFRGNNVYMSYKYDNQSCNEGFVIS